jgi:hypothetical protein
MSREAFETAGMRKARKDRSEKSTDINVEMMKDLAGAGGSQLERNPWTRKGKEAPKR